MSKRKQRIDKSEPYMVHIGYTYINELKKKKQKVQYRYRNLKTTPAKQRRLDKLKKYWKRSIK